MCAHAQTAHRNTKTNNRPLVVCNVFREELKTPVCPVCGFNAAMHIPKTNNIVIEGVNTKKKNGFYDYKAVGFYRTLAMSTKTNDQTISDKDKMQQLRDMWFDFISFPHTYYSMPEPCRVQFLTQLKQQTNINRPDLGQYNPAVWITFVIHHAHRLEQKLLTSSELTVFQPKKPLLCAPTAKPTPNTPVQAQSFAKHHSGICFPKQSSVMSKL